MISRRFRKSYPPINGSPEALNVRSGSKRTERLGRNEQQVFDSAHSGAAVPLTANSGHSTVLAERPWLGRVPPRRQRCLNHRMGGLRRELLFQGVDHHQRVAGEGRRVGIV